MPEIGDMISFALVAQTNQIAWCRYIDWGNVPAWLSAVGSILAFSLALRIYQINSQDRRMEQARLVSAIMVSRPTRLTDTGFSIERLSSTLPPSVTHIGGTHYDVVGSALRWDLRILNKSDEMIGSLQLTIYDSNGRRIIEMDHQEIVEPNGITTHTLVSRHEEAYESGYELGITFTDAAGHHWTRRMARPIKRVKRRKRTV